MAMAAKTFDPASSGGGGGSGDMLKADNLAGLASTSSSRANLGLTVGANLLPSPAALPDGNILVSSGSAWVAGADGSAPNSASYLTLATNGSLTSERVLTAGAGITLTDGGAGSTLTVAGSNWVKVGTTTLGADATRIDSVALDGDAHGFYRVTARLDHASASTDGHVVNVEINSSATNVTNRLTYSVGSTGGINAFLQWERSAVTELVAYIHATTGRVRVLSGNTATFDNYSGGATRLFSMQCGAHFNDTSSNIILLSFVAGTALMIKSGSTMTVERQV